MSRPPPPDGGPGAPPADPADAAFDARFAPLREVEPPAARVATTLRAVEDARFDEGFAALVTEPPAALVAATRAAMEAEVAAAARPAPAQPEPARPAPAAPAPQGAPAALPRGAGPWAPLRAVPRGVWPMVAVVAALLFMLVVPRPEPVADPRQLVEKGAGEVVPALALRGVVSRVLSEVEERVGPDTQYIPGDMLRFRVTTPRAGTLRLRRNGELVWTGPVAEGDVDLPIGWAFAAGEGAARFTAEMDGTLPASIDTLPPRGER